MSREDMKKVFEEAHRAVIKKTYDRLVNNLASGEQPESCKVRFESALRVNDEALRIAVSVIEE